MITKILDWLLKLMCNHEWTNLFCHPVTYEITERYCKKCNQHQQRSDLWTNIS